MLKPLVPVYSATLRAKQWLLAHRWLAQRTLSHPVISVGSLSAGGAGKTPVVIMLAELLAAAGYEVRILTRGYGRTGSRTERVLPDGDPKRFGDEPLMMAARLPSAAIWVGANRHRAGKLTERNDAPRDRARKKIVYLLDDGFQHHKLVRDIDVVLITRQDITDDLLPLGNLREPLQAMQRADIVVMREEENFAAGLSGPAATWFVRRSLHFPQPHPRPNRTVAFCGLARPEGFFSMLAEAGIEPAAVSIFRDHHVYTDSDINSLVGLARTHFADAFVTTEKDAIKLTPAMRVRLGHLIVPQLTLTLTNPEACLAQLLSLLRQ